MRLVNFATPDGPRAGVLRDGRVFEVFDAPPGGLQGLVEAGWLDAVEAGPEVEGAELLPPIAHPGKLICIGLNYRAHAQEQGGDPPETPTFFAKFANALRPSGATVELPRWSFKVDYRQQVFLVIADRCKDVPADEALRHVAGYTLFNDLSARVTAQFKIAAMDALAVRHFRSYAGFGGPALGDPGRGAGRHDAIGIELRLNGECVMQQSSTADLVHSIPELVA